MINEKFNTTLWDTTNKLHGSVSAAEYKHPVLRLVFLKCVSGIRQRTADPASGHYYTPKSVADLLVEVLTPFKGTIYDLACGSDGMFVPLAKLKDAHQSVFDKSGWGRKGDFAIYDQEALA